jgi:YbbR domain-containing protein
MIAFLRNLFLEDVWLKVFSLALAILTWLTVRVAIQKEVSPVPGPTRVSERTFFSLPVALVSSTNDVRGFRVEPRDVELVVQGDARTLDHLQSGDLHVTVDLTGLEPGGDLHKRIAVSTPAGVTHVRVSPPDVLVIPPSKL